MPHQVGPETAGDWTIQQMAYLSVDFLAYLIYLYIYIVFLAGYHGLVGNPQHDRRKVELMWFSIVEWKCTVLSFWGMLQWTIGFQRDSHSRTNPLRWILDAHVSTQMGMPFVPPGWYGFEITHLQDGVWNEENRPSNDVTKGCEWWVCFPQKGHCELVSTWDPALH
jgi:hypothetical protein